MQSRKALGRGLDALIPTATTMQDKGIFSSVIPQAALGERIKTVPIDSIVSNRLQPRKVFDEEKIKELAASIREQGIIQPLIVTQAGGNRFELIAGERRLRASKEAGLTEVPVVIKNVDTEGMLEISLIENVQREDLNPIEEANAIRELIDQFNYSQDEVAKRLGKSRVAIANSLRLLNLPKVIQDDVVNGRLSAGHARALLAVTSLQEQLRLRERVLNAVLTVRDIEKIVQNLKAAPGRKHRSSLNLTPQIKHLLEEMTKRLATKVLILPDRKNKGGKIIVDYYSPQDLNRIYNVVMK